MKHYVYLYFRRDGTPCYIGKGKKGRWQHHIKHATNKYLKAIIVKEGDLPCVKLAENLSDTDACYIEKLFIAAIGRKAHGGPLVNMTDGGEGMEGYRHTAEGLERLKAAWLDPQVRTKRLAALDLHRGRPHTAESIEKLRARVVTEVTRERMRIAAAARWAKPEEHEKSRIACAKRPPISAEIRIQVGLKNRGRIKTLAEREKLSQALKGRSNPRIPGQQEKITAANRGKKRSPESRERIRRASLKREAEKRVKNSA